jgi:hypothetical protein
MPGRFGYAILAGLLLVVGPGCGQHIPVEGTVTLDGKPLHHATVTFNPAGGVGNPAHAVTDEAGYFRMTTVKFSDGIMPGDYTITITIAHPPVKMEVNDKMSTNEVMALYGKAMAERKKNPPPPLPKIPAIYADPGKTPLRQRIPPDGRVKVDLRSDGST